MSKIKTMKKKNMKARGIRFQADEWKHLETKAGPNGTPSDAARELVRADMKRKKK